MPSIHKDLSVPEVLSRKNSILLRALIPTDLMNMGNFVYNKLGHNPEGVV